MSKRSSPEASREAKQQKLESKAKIYDPEPSSAVPEAEAAAAEAERVAKENDETQEPTMVPDSDSVADLIAEIEEDPWAEDYPLLEKMEELTKRFPESTEEEKAEIKKVYLDFLNELLLGDESREELIAMVSEWAPLADHLGIGSGLILDWVKLETQITPAKRIAAEINKIFEADAKIVSQLREAGLDDEVSSIEGRLEDEFDELLEDVAKALADAMKKYFPRVDQDPFNTKKTYTNE